MSSRKALKSLAISRRSSAKIFSEGVSESYWSLVMGPFCFVRLAIRLSHGWGGASGGFLAGLLQLRFVLLSNAGPHAYAHSGSWRRPRRTSQSLPGSS